MMSFALIISIREHVITFCNFSTIPISKSKGTILRFRFNIEVDEIFNLACPASPKHYQFDPVQTTKTSIHGAINVLGLAKRLKAKSVSGLDQ